MGIERVPCTECMGKGYNMVPRVIQGENNRLITIDVREDCIPCGGGGWREGNCQ